MEHKLAKCFTCKTIMQCYGDVNDIDYRIDFVIKLTKKQHNSIIKTRPKTWINRFQYHLTDDGIVMKTYFSILFIALMTISLPFLVLWWGIGNIKTTWTDYLSILREEYTSDFIYKNSRMYNAIMDCQHN